MNRALWKKSISESAILFVAVAIAIGLFSWFRVWIVGELDTTRFKQIVELLPDDWRQFTSVEFDWLISYLGRTSLTLDEPLLVMLMAIFAIVRGSDVISGEISRGTMEMLLAQPVSRRQVFWTPVTVNILGVILLAGVVWACMWLGVVTTTISESVYPSIRIPIIEYNIPLTFLPPKTETMGMAARVNALDFGPGILNLCCMGFFLVGVATLFSSFDRYRWRTLGIVVGFYMVSAMLKILAMTSLYFRWMMWLTFFACYEPESFIQQAQVNSRSQFNLLRYDDAGALVDWGPLGYNLIFLVLGSLCLVVASQIFRRRDVPAPV